MKDQIILFTTVEGNPLFATTKFTKPNITIEKLKNLLRKQYGEYAEIKWLEDDRVFMITEGKGFRIITWTWIKNYN